MRAKEKAKELVSEFMEKCYEGQLFTANFDPERGRRHLEKGKGLAFIAVNEIIKSNPIVPLQYMLESEALDAANEYWNEVKQEIEKL